LVIFAVSIVIPVALSFYHSYWIDFQPQGRYLMPMLIPFMYFSVKGLGYILEGKCIPFLRFFLKKGAGKDTKT